MVLDPLAMVLAEVTLETVTVVLDPLVMVLVEVILLEMILETVMFLVAAA